jgi:hypothetical protein
MGYGKNKVKYKLVELLNWSHAMEVIALMQMEINDTKS